MKKMILLLLLIPSFFMGWADPGTGKISGLVTDSAGKGLPGASVILLRGKDSLLLNAFVAGKDGSFLFNRLEPGSYFIRVSAVGYQDFRSQILVLPKESPVLSLAPLVLSSDKKDLAAVTVTGRKPLMIQKAGKIILNVDASINNTGSTALEVLEKSPGVRVDKDGNISLNGKKNVMVMIDGKPTYLSPADLATLLSGMSASQLDQIELMTNPPAKYDAAGNSGIINIKTKKNTAQGLNGNLTLGYAQGRYWKSNNSLNLNYRNSKYNLFLNYSFNGGLGYTDLHLTRGYLEPDGKTIQAIFSNPSYLTRKSITNTLKVGMDYFLSPKTTIGFAATGFISPSQAQGNSTGFQEGPNGQVDSIASTVSHITNSWHSGGINLNFHQQFSASSDLKVDLDYLSYSFRNDQLFYNTNTYPDQTLISNGDLQGFDPSDIQIYSAKADYSYLFKDSLTLEAGWKSSLVKTANQANYFNLDSGTWVPDYGKTNHFIYQENINAAYINFNRQIKKWNLQAGLRFENTNYQGHQLGNPVKPDSTFTRHYYDLFPTAYLTYQADSNHQFSLSFGRRIDRPAYQSLNPFLFYINEYTYLVGNPFLLPQYTYSAELSHVFKNKFTTTLSYSNTLDFFEQIFNAHGDTTIFGQGNLGRQENFGISLNLELNPASWWTMVLHADLNYERVYGVISGTNIQTSAPNGQFNFNNDLHFKKGWSAEVSGFYNSTFQEAQFIIRPSGDLSLGLAKQLFHNKSSIKLNLRDILFTQVQNGYIDYQNVHEHFVQSRDSRVVNLSFSYRFGKKPKDAGVKRRGGATEEQSRVKTN
jgi:iron complex outermembrane recepter protein